MSYPIMLSQGWAKLAEEVDNELARARAKFPNSKLVTTALTEEHGEAIRAVLEHYYALERMQRPSDMPHLAKQERIRKYRAAVRKELVQTMAMCIRLELEGDEAHQLTPAEED